MGLPRCRGGAGGWNSGLKGAGSIQKAGEEREESRTLRKRWAQGGIGKSVSQVA